MASMVRSTALLLALSSVGLLAVACSTSASDDAGTDTANATGGTSGKDASFVYVFSPASENPVCTGALIADKAVVIARSCLAEDLQVSLGKRGDDPLFFNKAKVIKSHVPDRLPADIAVLELDSKIASPNNMVTRYPLRAGYTVYARQSASEGFLGLGGASPGTTTRLLGALVNTTDTQASLLPGTGSKLCTQDLGAMVCSSTEKTDLFDLTPRDKCGLAGIVVAAPEGGLLDKNGCSNEAWKVAPLGLYEEFLSQFAPNLFKPYTSGGLLGTGLGAKTFVPDGLWGYDSAGDVASCSIETATLENAKKFEMRSVRAKASFKGMAKHAEAVGQIGIASKDAPNTIWWTPATRGSLTATEAFDDTFTQEIGANADGEYIVTYRVSANGGESWTRCDDTKRPLALVVNGETTAPKVVTPPTTTTTTTTPPPADAGAPPAADAGTTAPPTAKPPVVSPEPPAEPKAKKPATDDPSDDGEGEGEDDGLNQPSNPSNSDKVVSASSPRTSDSGCSTAPGSAGGNLPMIGLLFGLAALIRRRK